MSRRATNTEDSRAGRRVVEMKQRGGGSSSGSSKASSSKVGYESLSPINLPPGRISRRLNGSSSLKKIEGEAENDSEDDEQDNEADRKRRGSGRRSTSNRVSAITTNGKKIDGASNYALIKRSRSEKKKQERKASVRKESYQIDATDSDLTDAPEVEEEEREDIIDDDDNNKNNGANIELDIESDSDGEMARKMEEAGDGESLLGSAISDRDDHCNTDEEEERHIIQDVVRRRAKAINKRRSRYSSATQDERSYEEEIQCRQYHHDESTTLSPEIIRRLGLDEYEDELFSHQEPFHSSSEPSFTDFFGSDSEDNADDEYIVEMGNLKPRLDDDELTTDDEDEDDDETEISDLDEGLLSEALAAGISTQLTATTPASELGPADIPLLVIEDLDGRLIYARAGDGEAVFGSDGEFEFLDESDEDDTDEDMDGLGHDWNQWRAQDALNGDSRNGAYSDEGDTTDELLDEDMPFPRLLIGSVAPSGGRNTRRAKAMAARSRRLSPNTLTSRERSLQRGQSVDEAVPGINAINSIASAISSPIEQIKELDFSISTEELARDPQATLEAAAKSLGLTVEEVARLVIGIQADGVTPIKETVKAEDSASANVATSQNTSTIPKPLMGSFMPSSFKSVRRAVIDGNRQAPSPFLSRTGVQKKGLANRKRHASNATPSTKRIKRFSSNDFASLQDVTGEETSEVQTTSREASPAIDEMMDLDDVLDATMLSRGIQSSSPPPMIEDQSKTPVLRASTRSSTTANKAANKSMTTPSSKQQQSSIGLNLNAFARWHRIPMGAFREGQGAATSSMSQQPLGSFLLTRSNRTQQSSGNRNGHGDSPFRGRGEGDSIHFGTAPTTRSNDSEGRSAAFMVSPVLWPVRSSTENKSDESLSLQKPAWYPPSIQNQVMTYIGTDNNVARNRKVTTKREKRLRRARKAAAAAIKVAMQEADGVDLQSTASNSPITERDSLLNDSPAMPRLSISSPNASPLVKSKAPLSTTIQEQTVIDLPNTTSPAPIMATNANSHNSLSSGDASTNASSHQPPSSIFGVPLHSPLFGGILTPINLGFRDDLEDREDDSLLMI